MKQRTVEAVGLAHKPGRNTIKGDVARAFRIAFIRLLFCRGVPIGLRDTALSVINRLANWFLCGRWVLIGGGSKGNTFENDLLKLIFQAVAIANIADNAASAPLTNLYVSLHTADPGEAGDQTTSEVAYTSYARVAVARTSGGWAASTNTITPVANIDFPAGTGGSGTATYFAVGTVISAAGKLLYSGTVTPNIVCGNGVTPRLTTASTITED